jgi:hypothetical protein
MLARVQFERRLSRQLNEIEIGLAEKACRRMGDAWPSVVDAMYQKRAGEMTFANLASIMSDCAPDAFMTHPGGRREIGAPDLALLYRLRHVRRAEFLDLDFASQQCAFPDRSPRSGPFWLE